MSCHVTKAMIVMQHAAALIVNNVIMYLIISAEPMTLVLESMQLTSNAVAVCCSFHVSSNLLLMVSVSQCVCVVVIGLVLYCTAALYNLFM